MGVIRQEVYFSCSWSFDTAPGWCTFWIGPATLSCINSYILYASLTQFVPIVSHLKAQAVLPTLIDLGSFTFVIQTGVLFHQRSQANLWSARICFMLIHFSSHYFQYVVFLILGQCDSCPLSLKSELPCLRKCSTSYEKFGTTKMAGHLCCRSGDSVLSDNNTVSSVLVEQRSNSTNRTILMVALDDGRSSMLTKLNRALSNSGSSNWRRKSYAFR